MDSASSQGESQQDDDDDDDDDEMFKWGNVQMKHAMHSVRGRTPITATWKKNLCIEVTGN